MRRIVYRREIYKVYMEMISKINDPICKVKVIIKTTFDRMIIKVLFPLPYVQTYNKVYVIE